MRSLVAGAAIALALLGAASCEAKLEGAPCPCIEPAYTCNTDLNICVSNDGFSDPDASPGLPDGSLTPDAGFFDDGGVIPDAGFLPDADV